MRSQKCATGGNCEKREEGLPSASGASSENSNSDAGRSSSCNSREKATGLGDFRVIRKEATSSGVSAGVVSRDGVMTKRTTESSTMKAMKSTRATNTGVRFILQTHYIGAQFGPAAFAGGL